MKNKTGRFKIIEQFLLDGITYMFGNPGTVEQGFLDALSEYPEMNYFLTLQESIAVLTADGFARATQKPTLVQLHSAPGIGNAVGALYQAKRGHSPLVVIGGDAGIKYMNMDSQMANDLVAMMKPVTKYSTMVLDSRSLLRTLRRAIKIASTPPMGPVYICLPQDILDEINNEDIFKTCIPSTRVSPDNETIEHIAQILLEAKKPMIYIGDGIAYSGATKEITKVAEILGAEVYGCDVGDFNMDTMHPCYKGTTGHMFGKHSLPILKQGDVNLIIGTYMVPEVYPELGDIFADKSKIIHFDLNSYEIAKNHRVDYGIVCDPKSSLQKLEKILNKKISDERKRKSNIDIAKYRSEKDAIRLKSIDDDAKFIGKSPLHMSQFMKVFAEKAPNDTIIFDEALTNFPELVKYFPPRTNGSYFDTRGGSLGVGIPGAIGVKLANKGKTVVGFTGDGGSMYTIQAIWSAARHNVGAKFIICNNGSYRLLQLNVNAYWDEIKAKHHNYPLCFDLSKPPINFAQLAQAMGIKSIRVEKEEEINNAIEQMFSDDLPFLIDLVLEGDVHPELIGVKCGQ
jgi:benzoylformate decarboxylase